MSYQSKYSGLAIDAGIDMTAELQTETENLQLQINNLQLQINNLNNTINFMQEKINTIDNKVIPISQGGTGATNINQAISNLGGSYIATRWEATSTTGTISTTLTITTHGRPVFVGMQYTMQGNGGDGYWGTASIFRDNIHLQSGTIVSPSSSYNQNGALLYLDNLPAGTYVYKFQYGAGNGTIQLNETNTPSGKQPETPIVFAFEI